MTLLQAKIGQTVRVVSFADKLVRARLHRLGVYSGDALRVIRKAPLGGPVMVSVGGREMALGRGVAEQILVEID